jgi:DNA-binding transcriptional ArsR family regulator
MTTPNREHRTLDIESLKGLAHPLRAQLLETLSAFGPATASQLGDRLGESSGATSYHLRILEKHGFVREDATRGTGRERYWERTPVGLTLNVTDFEADSAARAAAETVGREWDRSRAGLLEEFNRRGPTELPKEWYDASAINTINLQLTSEQLTEFAAEVGAVFERWVSSHKQPTPGSRPVQSHFNAFPVMGGHVSGAE